MSELSVLTPKGVMLDLNNYLDPKSDAAKRLLEPSWPFAPLGARRRRFKNGGAVLVVGVANKREVPRGVMSSARITWCASKERGREAAIVNVLGAATPPGVTLFLIQK